jgi:CRISPR-associated protein Csm2
MDSNQDKLAQYAKEHNMEVKPPQQQQRQNYPQQNVNRTPQQPPQVSRVTKPEFLNEDADYVDIAERKMRSLGREGRNPGELDFGNLTTSKIRNILSMSNEIYNSLIACTTEKLDADLKSKLKYLKIRLVYEAGRDDGKLKEIRNFIIKSELISALDFIGDSKALFEQYSKYLEALTAYHRFLGGRD